MSDLPSALIYTFPNLYNCHFLYITSTQPLITATTCANTNHSTENGKRALDDEEGLGPVSQLAQKGNNLLRVKAPTAQVILISIKFVIRKKSHPHNIAKSAPL